MRHDITVNGVTYDIEQHTEGLAEVLTIEEFPGLRAEIGNEEYIEEWMSPRDACNVGVMAVSYDRYDLGDEDISKIDFEVQCQHCDGTGETIGPENMVAGWLVRPPNCPYCEGVGMIDISPTEYFKKERGARVVLPLSVYEHSGITMFVGHKEYMFDPGGWDTSYVGFIFDTPETLKETMGDDVTDEQIEKALRQEVALYASYLEGDVTYYRVEDEETGYDDGCGGYVGESEYTESECFSSLENAIEKRLEEIKERADMAARDIITKE